MTPEAAVDRAAAALCELHHLDPEWARMLARGALEAAVPVLVEAERARLRQQIVRVNQRMLAAVGEYYRLAYPDPEVPDEH